MKTVFHLSYLVAFSMLLSSCYSSKMLVDDDVYVLKSSSLPVGESLTDETSYSTYKNRKNKNRVNNNYYRDNRNYLYNNNCNHFTYNRHGCGCSFYATNVYGYYYNPYGYGRPSLYYGHGFHNAFGNYAYDPFLGAYIYNPYYYSPYGYYPGSYYGGSYYAGPYNNPYNAANISYSTPPISSNQHSGPRGSISGFGNPAGRNSNNVVLKNSVGPAGSVKPTNVATLRDRPLGRPTENVKPTTSTRPNTAVRPSTDRPIAVPNTYRPTGERTARPAPGQARPSGNRPAGNRPSGIEQRPQQNRDINTPRQNREAAPKGGQGGNTPRGGNTPTPSGRRN